MSFEADLSASLSGEAGDGRHAIATDAVCVRGCTSIAVPPPRHGDLRSRGPAT